jgi:phosphoglycerate dehydrogenase-like enzyme
VQLYSAGIDPYQKLNLSGRPQPLTLTHLRDFFGKPVAETAVAGILALYRKTDELARLQSQARWVGGILRPSMQLLHEKRVVILGAGAIGSTIQTILQGFSCPVQMVRRSAAPTLADLDQLLPEADILINCLPETSETKVLLDARRLGLMKKTALFVNVGRGSVVDEPALIEALQQDRLGGAVLDVSHTEPLPPDHPLWTCPRVLLTQHTGGGYETENADKVRVFTENLRRYRAGEPLLHVVDLEKGY